MAIAVTPYDFLTIEKLRQQELEEAQDSKRYASIATAEGVTISHEFQTADEVRGDYLDYFPLSDGAIGMYIGDVLGKGLPAAICAALVVGTLRGIHKRANLQAGRGI